MSTLDLILAIILLACGAVGAAAAIGWFIGQFEQIFNDKGDWK